MSTNVQNQGKCRYPMTSPVVLKSFAIWSIEGKIATTVKTGYPRQPTRFVGEKKNIHVTSPPHITIAIKPRFCLEVNRS